MGRGAGAAITALFTTVVASTAHAAPTSASPSPTKQACIDAATRGQIQRDDGKLSSAAEAFAICASSTCPASVRRHCTGWLADTKEKIPRVTVQLDPDDQADAASAKVEIDGNPATLGAPTELDPGRHSVSVERPDKPTLTEDFTLEAGENKTVVVHPPAPPTLEPKPEPITKRPVPLGVFILGGVALAGVASWATFGLLAKSDTDRMLEECAPGCPESDKDSAFVKAVIADVSLGVGALAAIGAGFLFFTRPTLAMERAPAASPGAEAVHVRPAIGLGRLGISGTF